MIPASSYYDDNFGHYDIESEEDIEFYHQVQQESVWKRCEGCLNLRRLRPHYGLCNSCATNLECGWDLPSRDLTLDRIRQDINSATEEEDWDKLAYLAAEAKRFQELEQQLLREQEQELEQEQEILDE